MTISRPKVLTAFMLEYIDRLENRGIDIESRGHLETLSEVEITIEEPPAVPQTELMKYLDCSSEPIRRIMKEFEDRGIVELVDEGGPGKSKKFILADEPAAEVIGLFG